MKRSARIRTRWALLLVLPLALTGCAAEPDTATVARDSVEKRRATVEPTPSVEEPEDGSVTGSADAAEPPALSQAELDAQLRAAAWANDVEAAEQLIARGADVNAKDDTVQSAYLIATSEGHLELLRLTLANGADVHDLDSWVGTGLIRAAERGHWAVVGELIQAGAPLDHVNRIGYQAIHEAVWLGRDDPSYHATVRVLVAGGASLGTPSGSERLTPLQMAGAKGFAEQAGLLQALIDAPPPADPREALLAAAESGDANAAVLALRAGAPVEGRGPDGRTALELAERGGHISTAQVIRALGG